MKRLLAICLGVTLFAAAILPAAADGKTDIQPQLDQLANAYIKRGGRMLVKESDLPGGAV